MTRTARRLVFLALALASPLVAAQPAVPVPGRSRALTSGPDAGLVESARSFRQTVRFYRTWFKRQGIDVQAVPVYAYRGVTIARFLARNPRTSWRAVHVFRHQGRTFIRIVERDHKPLDRSREPG